MENEQQRINLANEFMEGLDKLIGSPSAADYNVYTSVHSMLLRAEVLNRIYDALEKPIQSPKDIELLSPFVNKTPEESLIIIDHYIKEKGVKI